LTDHPVQPEPILQALQRHEVEYVIIGGFAAQLHGDSSPTRGIDLVPRVTEDSLRRLGAALNEVRATEWIAGRDYPVPVRLDRSRLTGTGSMLLHCPYGQIGVYPTLIAFPHGWEQLYPASQTRSAYGMDVRVAALPDLLRSYQTSTWAKYRPRIERLTDIQRTIDRDGPLDPYQPSSARGRATGDPVVALMAAEQLARLFDDARPALAYARRALLRAADEADYGDPGVARQHLGAAVRSLRECHQHLQPLITRSGVLQPGSDADSLLVRRAIDELTITAEHCGRAIHPSGRGELRDLLVDARLHAASADSHLEQLHIQLERTARSFVLDRLGRGDTGRQ
jgi:hypothetical protein